MSSYVLREAVTTEHLLRSSMNVSLPASPSTSSRKPFPLAASIISLALLLAWSISVQTPFLRHNCATCNPRCGGWTGLDLLQNPDHSPEVPLLYCILRPLSSPPLRWLLASLRPIYFQPYGGCLFDVPHAPIFLPGHILVFVTFTMSQLLLQKPLYDKSDVVYKTSSNLFEGYSIKTVDRANIRVH